MIKGALKIKKSVYKSLLNDSPYVPPESGGVIGGNNKIVTCFVADAGKISNEFNRYEPDTKIINNIISYWLNSGIDFMGLYHTHPSGDEKLSQADMIYIKSIMKSISEYTNALYFPLIIPKEKMISYYAKIIADKVNIFETAIEIL